MGFSFSPTGREEQSHSDPTAPPVHRGLRAINPSSWHCCAPPSHKSSKEAALSLASRTRPWTATRWYPPLLPGKLTSAHCHSESSSAMRTEGSRPTRFGFCFWFWVFFCCCCCLHGTRDGTLSDPSRVHSAPKAMNLALQVGSFSNCTDVV